MANKTTVARMALAHLKVNENITDVDVDESEALNVVLLFLEEAVNYMVETKKPAWAENYVNLGLVEENPNDYWLYSFRYPTDCAAAIEICDETLGQSSSRDSVPYRLGSDASGRLIYTNYGSTAVLRYVRKQDDNGALGWRFEDLSSAWAIALSYLCAALSAGALSNTASSDQLMRKYEYMVSQAAAVTLNEQGYEDFPDSEAVRARSI